MAHANDQLPTLFILQTSTTTTPATHWTHINPKKENWLIYQHEVEEQLSQICGDRNGVRKYHKELQ